MGYTTRFTGAIALSRPLTLKEAKILLDIASEPDRADALPFAHPDRYLQWVPTTDLQHIVWDESEKFYEYVPWMTWMCEVLASWGIVANGTLYWSGESVEDTGIITVVDTVVQASDKRRGNAGEYLEPLTAHTLSALVLKTLDA